MTTSRQFFREITSAPADIPVEVLHHSSASMPPLSRKVTLAVWDSARHAWVKVGDPDRRPLRRLVAWRPAR